MYNLCFVSDTIKAVTSCESQHEGGKLKWQRTQAQIAEQKTVHRTTHRTNHRTATRIAHRTIHRIAHRIATVRTILRTAMVRIILRIAILRTNLLTSQHRMLETDTSINF